MATRLKDWAQSKGILKERTKLASERKEAQEIDTQNYNTSIKTQKIM